MFYEIYLDDLKEKCLYYPNDIEYKISNATIKEAINECSVLQFSISREHPFYDEIKVLKTQLFVWKDIDYTDNPLPQVFKVKEITTDMFGTSTIYALDEMCDLFDIIQPQREFKDTQSTLGFAWISQWISLVLTAHNDYAFMEVPQKTFEVGEIQDDIARCYSDYESTMETIRRLCDENNLVMKIRHEHPTRYLDIFRASYLRCEQEIKFGVNLLEYTTDEYAESLYTALVPLGAKLKTPAFEEVESYLTVASVNGGSIHISDEDLFFRYGYIERVEHFDDVTDARTLLRLGQEKFSSQFSTDLEIRLSAIDLSMLVDSGIEPFEVGKEVHIICEPFGIDMWIPVQERTIDLQDISKNVIVVSGKKTGKYVENMRMTIDELSKERK